MDVLESSKTTMIDPKQTEIKKNAEASPPNDQDSVPEAMKEAFSHESETTTQLDAEDVIVVGDEDDDVEDEKGSKRNIPNKRRRVIFLEQPVNNIVEIEKAIKVKVSRKGETKTFGQLRRKQIPKKMQSAASKGDDDTKNVDSDSTNYVGKFVRKQFGEEFYFGVITSYDEEFWHIVYEDRDTEDFNWTELHEFYWDQEIPQDKKQKCLYHAQTLGLM